MVEGIGEVGVQITAHAEGARRFHRRKAVGEGDEESRELERARRGRLLGFVAFLVVFYLAAIFGPPPPSEQMVAWGALVLWLVPLYAAWVDRARPTDGAR